MSFSPFPLASPTGATLNVFHRAAEGRPRGVVQVNHGLAEHAARYARFAGALAARGFHVYAHDHRGHGATTAPDAPPGRFAGEDGAEKIVADVAAVLDRIGEAHPGLPVIVFGHSMGGRVALQLTLDHPELVRSLILMDTSAWSFQPDDEGVREMMASFIDRYDPERGLPDLSALGGPEQDLILETCPAAWNERKDVMAAAFDPWALKALGEELFKGTAGSLRPRLAELHVPVTVLCGERDHPLVDQVPELTAEIPGATSTIIEGAYHSPQLTHQAAWRAAVEAHLDRAR